ncbi:osmoprotectant transport system permease protein [Anaerobacterium chartisolvens]|uniref:Osmoprotectant transport system permease protein n=1 Tax=Anaerobacterium chartisolvens TaxID=1297424 RepID=A0A369BK92_9FIRM|nr:ABC transporter permease [Anaerobacterium chartisolvens]RCX20996.1 osmoprotectant transport system permease protein [Anaerobacterium chartisolvens]
MSQIFMSTYEHLRITFEGVAIAIIVGIAVGIVISRHKAVAGVVMSVADIIQTIPSLALLAVLMMVFGLGNTPAVVALFMYSFLPIVRNTYVGITGVDKSLTEAGTGMGMTRLQLLFKVKIPIAMPIIFSGIRVAVVTALGVATIGVFIGSGGLGNFIYRGVQMGDVKMILWGAIPLSILAIGFDVLLEQGEKRMVKSRARRI